jgi:hypothetical protein
MTSGVKMHLGDVGDEARQRRPRHVERVLGGEARFEIELQGQEVALGRRIVFAHPRQVPWPNVTNIHRGKHVPYCEVFMSTTAPSCSDVAMALTISACLHRPSSTARYMSRVLQKSIAGQRGTPTPSAPASSPKSSRRWQRGRARGSWAARSYRPPE